MQQSCKEKMRLHINNDVSHDHHMTVRYVPFINFPYSYSIYKYINIKNSIYSILKKNFSYYFFLRKI